MDGKQNTLGAKIEEILVKFETGGFDLKEATESLVSLNVEVSINRLMNLCQQVKKVRDIQNRYFLTRDSKVLRESKQMERELDGNITTFFEIASERQNPTLPLESWKLDTH